MHGNLFGSTRTAGEAADASNNVVAPGVYRLAILGFEEGNSQRQGAPLGVTNKWLTAKLQVTDGPAAGTLLTPRLYLDHDKPITTKIAEEMMAKMAIAALGRRDINLDRATVQQMIGKIVNAKLGVKKGGQKKDGSGDYPDSNTYQAFMPAGAVGPAAPQVPTGTPMPPPGAAGVPALGGGTAPWAAR